MLLSFSRLFIPEVIISRVNTAVGLARGRMGQQGLFYIGASDVISVAINSSDSTWNLGDQ
jgi:hypothetical protein